MKNNETMAQSIKFSKHKSVWKHLNFMFSDGSRYKFMFSNIISMEFSIIFCLSFKEIYFFLKNKLPRETYKKLTF